MILNILNTLHRKGYRRTLNLISRVAYFLKGFGYVRTSYHPDFRAYEYIVQSLTFLSLGPGWAYCKEYLLGLIKNTYNFYYMPKAGDCVVDIGAGLGEETSMYSLLVGEKGSVHALEANPTTFAGLDYMCKQNHFSWTKAHNLAIYNSNGEVTIEDDEENYLTNTINATSGSAKSFTVKARTLDAFVKENGITRIDFLKSNIEGAEQFLIQGMEESKHILQNVCISCHDFRHVFHNHGEFYMTKEKIKNFLEQNGFEVWSRITDNRVSNDYLFAKKKVI